MQFKDVPVPDASISAISDSIIVLPSTATTTNSYSSPGFKPFTSIKSLSSSGLVSSYKLLPLSL